MAAGMEIGSDELVVAVPPDRDPQPVRAVATFTPDRQALVDGLQECQIDTVALESTGVSWIPIDDLLEQRGCGPTACVSRRPTRATMETETPLGIALNGKSQ